MAKRSAAWSEGLAQDLRNPEFAREFLLAAVEEGVPLQRALGKVIRATGVKEYAELTGLASSNVQRAIRARHNPTQVTLNRMLKPFGLKLSVARIAVSAGDQVRSMADVGGPRDARRVEAMPSPKVPAALRGELSSLGMRASWVLKATCCDGACHLHCLV